MMRQSINITDTGLWVVHLALFQSGISQIIESRLGVSPHSLLLVLVAAPMLPMPLYQCRLVFNWIVLQHTLRKDLVWSRPAINSSPKFFAELLWCQLPISFPTLQFSSAPIQVRRARGSHPWPKFVAKSLCCRFLNTQFTIF